MSQSTPTIESSPDAVYGVDAVTWQATMDSSMVAQVVFPAYLDVLQASQSPNVASEVIASIQSVPDDRTRSLALFAASITGDEHGVSIPRTQSEFLRVQADRMQKDSSYTALGDLLRSKQSRLTVSPSAPPPSGPIGTPYPISELTDQTLFDIKDATTRPDAFRESLGVRSLIYVLQYGDEATSAEKGRMMSDFREPCARA